MLCKYCAKVLLQYEYFVCVCVFCVFMFYGLKPEINAFIHSFNTFMKKYQIVIFCNTITCNRFSQLDAMYSVDYAVARCM